MQFNWRRSCFAVLVLLCGALSARAEDSSLDWEPAHSHLFAVGVLQWQREDVFDSFPQNKHARRDDQLVECFRKAGVPDKQIRYLKDRQATKARIVAEFTQLLDRAGEDDLLIFYFCGHGYRDRETGKAWLANYDAAKDDDTGWPMADILDLIERRFRGNRALLLVDCCHSGALCDEAASRETTRVHYAILTSACTHNTASSHWTYTDCLLTGLRGGEQADLDEDGQVDLGELARFTELEMAFVEERKAMFLITGDFDDLTRLATVKTKSATGAGRRIEVFSDDRWFRAKVVTIQGLMTRVHFVDFDDSYDEWVKYDKIRPYQPPQFAEGDRVFARWQNEDEWFPATVRQSFYGMALVHYEDGDDEKEDEWLDRRAVRLRMP